MLSILLFQVHLCEASSLNLPGDSPNEDNGDVKNPSPSSSSSSPAVVVVRSLWKGSSEKAR